MVFAAVKSNRRNLLSCLCQLPDLIVVDPLIVSPLVVGQAAEGDFPVFGTNLVDLKPALVMEEIGVGDESDSG